MDNKLTYPISERNFILQQGLEDPSPDSGHLQYSALHFQPRLVGLIAVLGIILQSQEIFLVLSPILWWNALLPSLNPFDALYNVTIGSREGAVRLTPAPSPRRFAQGMAGTFALIIGVALLFEWETVAFVFQALLLVALAALVLGRFCLGSFLFHLLRGRSTFARRTLPWKHSE